MRLINQFIIINVFLLSFVFAFEEQHVQVNVLEQTKNHVIIEYIIEDFNIDEINIKNEVYHDIDLNDEPDFLNKYSPKLPHINRSLIIPDLSSMDVTVLSSEYVEYRDINVLPSKGNPTRNIDV